MNHFGKSYTAQAWRDRDLRLTCKGLSIDAAREIAQTHQAIGDTGRVMSESEDYCEVYPPSGINRFGTFAETTLVHGVRS